MSGTPIIRRYDILTSKRGVINAKRNAKYAGHKTMSGVRLSKKWLNATFSSFYGFRLA